MLLDGRVNDRAVAVDIAEALATMRGDRRAG